MQSDALPDDVYAGPPASPSTVVISGPKHLVEGISRVVPACDVQGWSP